MYVHSGLKLCNPGWTQINSTATARMLVVQMCATGVDIKRWGLNFFQKKGGDRSIHIFSHISVHIYFINCINFRIRGNNKDPCHYKRDKKHRASINRHLTTLRIVLLGLRGFEHSLQCFPSMPRLSFHRVFP